MKQEDVVEKSEKRVNIERTQWAGKKCPEGLTVIRAYGPIEVDTPLSRGRTANNEPNLQLQLHALTRNNV